MRALLASLALLAGCTSASSAVQPTSHIPVMAHPSPSLSPRVSPAPRPSPHAAPAPRKAPARVQSAPRCAVPKNVNAPQVILVRGSGAAATVWACSRTPQGWRIDLGPFSGHVGYTGVAASGAKREGDGRTPSGTFPMREGFGLQANPGLTLGWKPVRSGDVWVDDSHSSLYNTRQTAPAKGRWRSAESLEEPRPYAIAQVIGYNETRTPGVGSAIFLHVDGGGPTAGCVSLTRGALESVMRWERAGVVMTVL